MYLTLDEKQIRKGRPVGLPYQGSKKKISKKIVELIKQNFGDDKTVYDLFGGGGAITAELLINNMNVVYNDFNKNVTDMFELVIKSDREFLKTLIVSRDEFYKIKAKENKTTADNLKLLVNSFGNNSKDYLYGEYISEDKFGLAVEIINNHDVFGGYKQTETFKSVVQQLEQLQRLQQLEQLEQLQRLQQLEQLEQLQQTEFIAYNNSYEHYSDLTGQVLYLDPPYEGTSHIGYEGTFESNAFYDWAHEMSKTNIVLISSYKIRDPRFEMVYEFTTARSTMNGGNSNREDKIERLFMVKGD